MKKCSMAFMGEKNLLACIEHTVSSTALIVVARHALPGGPSNRHFYVQRTISAPSVFPEALNGNHDDVPGC